MAEFTNNAVQVVNPNQPVILNTSIGCNKGYVYHRNESGIVTLRGIVNTIHVIVLQDTKLRSMETSQFLKAVQLDQLRLLLLLVGSQFSQVGQ